MSIKDNIARIESIKNDLNINNKNKENLFIDALDDLSRDAVDCEIINRDFAKLISPYLMESNFTLINSAELEDEIDYYTNAIGYGDTITFRFDEDEKLSNITYTNTDNRVKIGLSINTDRVVLKKDKMTLHNVFCETSFVYKKDNDGYYELYRTEKRTIESDDLSTSIGTKYSYKKDDNSLSKKVLNITKKNGKMISKSSINVEIPKSDFIVRDGKFYFIEKKQEEKLLKKAKILENRLINGF